MNYFDLDLSTISASAVAIVPIIIALVQGVKMAWSGADRFAPLIALLFGMLISIFADHETGDWTNSILSGVIYGLSASGLYSGVKSTAHANAENKRHRER
jgi:hypothetical protein